MSDDQQTSRPVSRSKRFLKLASMTASVASGYAKNRVKGVFQSAEDRERSMLSGHAAAGEAIAKTLGELKGAAMKIGQMASLTADMLPKEISGALKVLQKDSPPMPYEVIAEQIERELGSPPELLFEHFEREPFAAASIGQVHRARTDDGREVVVKVQYPGVDASVDSDLAHLKMAIRASGLVRGRGEAFKALFEEIRERLHEELDYTNEAENVRAFGRIHADHPFVVVPEVVGERSAQRVLTLVYEPGTHLNDVITEGFTQEERDQLARHFFEAFVHQIFREHAVHADPNPANFAYRRNGEIVFYDFGCVQRLSPETIRDYRDTIRATFDEDFDAMDAGLMKLGARVPGTEPPPAEFYASWRDLIVVPLLQHDTFDYGASKLHEDVIQQIRGSLRYIRSFQPPSKLAFLDRAVGGHYHTLRTLGARVHTRDLLVDALAIPQLGDAGFRRALPEP